MVPVHGAPVCTPEAVGAVLHQDQPFGSVPYGKRSGASRAAPADP